MGKVSKRVISIDLENHIFEIFIKTISKLKNAAEVQNFLYDLLSPTEKIMLIKRLAIAVMLTKGYTYDAIDHTLKVSRPTIMTVSYFLKHGKKGGYKKAVDEILKDQNREALFDKIEEILISMSPPKIYSSASYERKRKLGKELFRIKSLRNNF
ncbi:MAG: hypothetical protein UT92_C0017G0005 [Candidatus Curtissbacteria bacterium GW2011_GWA1_40_24]|uniref:TrpR like protein, YerC/YecD n=1 Tax=Candidatus Curtissbacteria bacterium GW2011_GWA1_40_24 TaxID=1618406 RepID=A0A0G0UVY7_9BACT|nr:MAG: hypothetical protein UT92_C0017G0005 [Candidatus Curtissbacteria bacterium GW2011_GWA1_40_24]